MGLITNWTIKSLLLLTGFTFLQDFATTNPDYLFFAEVIFWLTNISLIAPSLYRFLQAVRFS